MFVIIYGSHVSHKFHPTLEIRSSINTANSFRPVDNKNKSANLKVHL